MSEQVGDDNPLAVEVAKPLFDAKVSFLALTERASYTNRVFWSRPWHTFYLMIQGSLFFEFDKKKLELKPGEMCLCPAGIGYSHAGNKNIPVQWLYIKIDDATMWKPLKRNGFYTRNYESADLLFLLLRRILDAHRSRITAEIDLALSHSSSLLGLLRHEMTIVGHEFYPYSKSLEKMVAAMHMNPEREWSVSTMTNILKVSPRKLYRLFMKDYGIAPHELVVKIRISKAAVSLSRSDQSVGNIVESLGYLSVYSFSNLFKKHTGLRPTEYRKKFKRFEA